VAEPEPGVCPFCGERIASGASSAYEGIEDFADHLRVMHPDEYEKVEKWPDGSPVVVDNTLEPEEFGG
jgi:hypothetical protein